MGDRPLWVDVYILMVILSALLVVWTMTLISRSSFLESKEPSLLRRARRAALFLVACGILHSGTRHWEYGDLPYWGEAAIVIGFNIYLGLAIWASYKMTGGRHDYRHAPHVRSFIHH